MGLFSKYFEKRGMFSTYFEKIPLAPPPAAPSGRRRARRRGYFFQIFGKQTPFFKTFGKKTIHIFLIATFHFFQVTIIYKGTQVTMAQMRELNDLFIGIDSDGDGVIQ